jgi:hypothetical protein
MVKLEYNKLYYIKNKQKILNKMKEKYKVTGPKDYSLCKHSLLKYRKSLKGRFNAAKRRRSKAGHIFTISFKTYKELILLPCEYCGGQLNEQGLGLDRIDNLKGYIEGNVVPCCKTCNIMKNSFLSYEEMKVAMNAINTYRKQGNHLKEGHDEDTKK